MDVPDQASPSWPPTLSSQSCFLVITVILLPLTLWIKLIRSVILAVQRRCDGFTGPDFPKLGLISWPHSILLDMFSTNRILAQHSLILSRNPFYFTSIYHMDIANLHNRFSWLMDALAQSSRAWKDKLACLLSSQSSLIAKGCQPLYSLFLSGDQCTTYIWLINVGKGSKFTMIAREKKRVLC